MPFISTLKESFAVAPIQDRQQVVKKLATPNTEEARYYEGLILLQRIYDEVMKAAVPEMPRAATATELELAASMRELLNKFSTKSKHFNQLNTRFHLLIYPFETSTSIDYIKKELCLDTLTQDSSDERQSPVAAHALNSSSQNSVLDPRFIDGLDLITKKCQQATANDYFDLEPFAFPHLGSVWDTLANEQQVILLKKVLQSCLPSEHVFGKDLMDRLVTLWKLQHSNQSDFNNWKLEELPFYNLSLQQADYLIQEIPSIVFLHKSFISAYLDKLAPVEFEGDHASLSFWDDQDNILHNYLNRLSTFVDKLPATYAQLKLAAKLHTLRLHIVRREFKEESLLSFLSIMSPMSASVSPVPSRNLFGTAPGINSTRFGSPFGNTVADENSQPIVIPLLGSSVITETERKLVIREYLTGLIEQDKLTISIETLSAYADYHEFLKPLYAELMLTSGKPFSSRSSTEQYINVLGQHGYEALVNKSYVSFAPSSLFASVRRKPSDTIELGVRTKNIPHLSIRVYQIQTEDYWRLYFNDDSIEITRSGKVNLDGLCPTFEKDIDLSSERGSIHVETTTFRFGPDGLASDIFEGRGMWVVEFVGGQQQCRSIVQKGYLRRMVQSTAAGHLFRVIDEESNTIYDAKIWYNNQYYEADKETGDILVPYLQSDQNAKNGKVLLISPSDNFCEPAYFYQLTEQYELHAKFYVNHEMLYPHKRATVVVVPDLRLNGIPISLDLFEDKPTLVIDCSNINGVKNSVKWQQGGSDRSCIKVDFTVPDQLTLIEFCLGGKIKALNGKIQDLKVRHQIRFNSAFKQSGLPGSLHLQKSASDDYTLCVLGKNGESKKYHEVSLQLKHTFINEPISVSLKTDASGVIDLGKLTDIYSLTCSTPQGIYKEWVLADDTKQELPVEICVPANTSFKLPCPTSYSDSLYSLYQVGSQRLLVKNMTNCTKKGHQYLEVQGLPAGNYVLYVPSTTAAINTIRCTVIQPSVSLSGLWSKWILNDTIYAQHSTTAKSPLTIEATNINNTSIEIQLNHYSSHSYAIVTATVFVPSTTDRWDIQPAVGVLYPSAKRLSANEDDANIITTRAIFLDDQRISEEDQYILNRSKAEKWVGNNLIKPSLLLYPKKNADTVTRERYLEKGSVLHKRTTNNAAPRMAQYCLKSAPADMALCGLESASSYGSSDNSLEFLDHTADVVVVPVDYQTGKITISRDDFGLDKRLFQVMVMSGEQCLYQQVALPSPDDSKLKFNDRRQPNSSNKPLIRSKVISTLMPDQKILLYTHEYEVLDSFEKLFDIIKSISPVGDGFVEKFYFLQQWRSLSHDEKLSLHEKHVCHEFNLWLKKKDPQFFEACVKPALKSKVRKSFMDKYLIDEDLAAYTLTMHSIQQLSVAEKALLASASTSSQSFCNSILRLFKDTMNVKQFEEKGDVIFDSILAHGSPKTNASDHVDLDEDMGHSIADIAVVTNSAAEQNIGAIGYGSGSASAASSQPPPPPQSAAPFARSLFMGQARSASLASAASRPSPQSSESVVIEQEEEEDNEEAKQAALVLRAKAKEQQKKVTYTYIKPTAEYKETGYYDKSSMATTVKQFWIDFLEHLAQQKTAQGNNNLFLSKFFMYALDTVAEIFYVLSLMDLPFASETNWKAETVAAEDTQGAKVSAIQVATYNQPLLVFYRGLKEVQDHVVEKPHQTLMIGQEFFIVEKNVPIDSNECIKVNPLQTPFEPLVEYGNHLVISNASSQSITCQITVQVPTGSIPTQISTYCKSKTVSIDAYSTWHEVSSTFYFPEAGAYTIPPVTVSSSSGGELLAMVQSMAIEIKQPQASREESDDATTSNRSWPSIAKHGSSSSILSFLNSYSKLDKLDLSLIQGRMGNMEFARHVIDTLRSRYVYSRELWQYGLVHQFADVLRELLFFQASSLLQQTGYVFESPLVSTATAAVGDSEGNGQATIGVLDYYPMLHARVHPLNSTAHEILNQQFYAQYNKFLDYLTQKTTAPSAADLLCLTLYFLLQDRIGEAQNVYARIPADLAEKEVKVQFDYLGAYLKTCIRTTTTTTEELQMIDLQTVKDTAECYMKDFGVLQWRHRFADLYHFVCEVEQGYLAVSSEANLNNERVRSEEAILELDIDERERQLVIQYNEQVTSVQIKYYEMDIEVMFSNHPFMSHQKTENNNFQWIKPNRCTVVDLSEQRQQQQQHQNPQEAAEDAFDIIGVGQINTLHTLKLPFEGVNKNVFVEVSFGSLKRRQVYYANNIYAHVSEAFGVVRVMNKETKRPVVGAYVKVYARLKAGKQVHFWKDGYTGLNGVFDYVSVTEGNTLVGGGNGGDLKHLMLEKVDKLSILVSTIKNGAVVKEVYPPLNG